MNKDLEELKALSAKISGDIRAAYGKIPEGEKKELSEEMFTMLLGFLPAMRRIPGTDTALMIDNYFLKLERADKDAALGMFKKFMCVTDRESFREFFTGALDCNLSTLYNDIPAYLAGEPRLDMNELDDTGRETFLKAAEFVKCFVEYLPEAGFLALDISEKVGFARMAWGCDLIGNTDYCTIMLLMTDKARENFSSFEEYMLSLIFGGGAYMFHSGGGNVRGAIEYMSGILPYLVTEELTKYKWKDKED